MKNLVNKNLGEFPKKNLLPKLKNAEFKNFVISIFSEKTSYKNLKSPKLKKQFDLILSFGSQEKIVDLLLDDAKILEIAKNSKNDFVFYFLWAIRRIAKSLRLGQKNTKFTIFVLEKFFDIFKNSSLELEV